MRPSGAEPGARPAPPLDRFDREIIELLLSWVPYGDPPDDELTVEFGMPLSHLKGRLARRITETRIDENTDQYDRTLLVRVAKLLAQRPVLAIPTAIPAGQQLSAPLNDEPKSAIRTVIRKRLHALW